MINRNTNAELQHQCPAFAKPLLYAVYPCRKIRSGKYEYRGFIISRFGYHSPDKKVCWEGHNPNTGSADYHGFSKQQIKFLIDSDLSKK